MDEEIGNANPAMIVFVYPGQQDQIYSAGRRYQTPDDAAVMWSIEQLVIGDMRPNYIMFSVVGVDDEGKGWGFSVCHSGQFTLHWPAERLKGMDHHIEG